jgi:hypothetical protein
MAALTQSLPSAAGICRLLLFSVLTCSLDSLCLKLPASERAPFTAFAAGEADVGFCFQGGELLRFGTAVWGPNWAWAGVEGKTKIEDGAVVGGLTSRVGGIPVVLQFRAARIAPQELRVDYELTAEQDLDLTLFVVELRPGQLLEGSVAKVEVEGKQATARLPLGKGVLGDRVSALHFGVPGDAPTVVRFNPPVMITTDGVVRVVLAKDHLAAKAPRRLQVTVQVPGALEWYPSVADVPDEPGIEHWYPWQGTGASAESVFNLTDWLEKPAGKHGRIQAQGDQLIYNGKPIQLWGLNLCYGACAPDKALADKRAALYSRYGINSVRLHKFADGTGWSGIQSRQSVAEFDPEGLDRMDYQVARFKASGIYVKLSAHFGTVKIGPADRRDVPYLEEFGKPAGDDQRISAPHSAFFYSPELQQLHLRQILNLLRHRNPHTGLTYAKDPAICALEIINEQSVLFFTSMAPLKQSATLRRLAGERFSEWLRRQYGSQEGLTKAWGLRGLYGFEQDGFPAGEHLDRRNILPLGNPWYWDPDQLNGSQAFRRQRLLDTLRFLYELQCEAYDRYVAAVREAGYAGEILGSNWQAGRAYSHYANLHSDFRVGLIDRHNYFGGSGQKGKFNADSMLSRAGSGSLSSGLQQVEGRPFMLSEWIHVFPNEWGVEGPAIVGAYGMGLQGWDVSYLFQNGDDATFSRELGRSPWDVMAPQILGVFPAVSRQVLRGDVLCAPSKAVRSVHLPSLFKGRLGFEDQVVQGYDDKELDGTSVPAAALAVARCLVRFSETWEETPLFDLSSNRKQNALISSTRQLQWHQAQAKKAAGYFTMDTAGTKAVVGVAQGQTCQLGEVTIVPQSPFGAIYVTALEKDATIRNSRRLLVVAVARARNTGMKFSPAGDDLLERGKGPILMEPVKASIKLDLKRRVQVHPLDHNGCPISGAVPSQDNQFTVDGTVDRTPYYEVILE